MKIVITGASGLIGSELVKRLAHQSHTLTLLSRRPSRKVSSSGAQWLEWHPGENGPWCGAIDGADAVINLAGEPIAGKRWSPRQKQILRASRVDTTRALVGAIAKADVKPKLLISSSAVGYYSSRGEEAITEESRPGDDFLARLCVDWEAEARNAENLGVRVVLLRTGIVLAQGRGALQKMVPPFKMFAGGPLGSGKQFMPWIHIDDEVGLIEFALTNQSVQGPINAAAPNPVTMSDFCRALGDRLNRPSWAKVPTSVLTLLVGEMADMLLASQRVLPDAALKLGYKFKYAQLKHALEAIKL